MRKLFGNELSGNPFADQFSICIWRLERCFFCGIESKNEWLRNISPSQHGIIIPAGNGGRCQVTGVFSGQHDNPLRKDLHLRKGGKMNANSGTWKSQEFAGQFPEKNCRRKWCKRWNVCYSQTIVIIVQNWRNSMFPSFFFSTLGSLAILVLKPENFFKPSWDCSPETSGVFLV